MLLIALIIIQFFKPQRNHLTEILPNDISKKLKINDEEQALLKTSCYDCHSNNTVYPWYANVQPVAWWLNGHIVDGKRELNFSEFGSYNARRQYKKLEEAADQIKKGEMPLPSYTLIHRDAILNDKQKKILINWCNASINELKEKYPPDSLLKRQ